MNRRNLFRGLFGAAIAVTVGKYLPTYEPKQVRPSLTFNRKPKFVQDAANPRAMKDYWMGTMIEMVAKTDRDLRESAGKWEPFA